MSALVPVIVAATAAAAVVGLVMLRWRRAFPGVIALTFGAVLAGAIVVGTVLVMVLTHQGLAVVDRGAAEWSAAHATKASTEVLRLITDLGGTAGVAVVAVVVAVVEGFRRRARLSMLFVVAVFAGEELIVNLVKALVGRARPDFSQLVGVASASFPSGHAATAAAMWATFALLLGRSRPRSVRIALAATSAGVAAAVAASRVLLGVHWVTDVVAGLAVGWAWVAACSLAFGDRLVGGSSAEISDPVLPRG